MLLHALPKNYTCKRNKLVYAFYVYTVFILRLYHYKEYIFTKDIPRHYPIKSNNLVTTTELAHSLKCIDYINT